MKIPILSLLLLISQFHLSCEAQTVKVERLSFKTYSISIPLDSDIVDKTSIPKNFRRATGIVRNASNYNSPDTVEWINKRKAEWKKSNNPEDNGKREVKYGLVSKETGYYIRKFNTIVTYGVVEIGGGSRMQRYLKIEEKDFSSLLCLFNDSVKYTEGKVALFQIRKDDLMIQNNNMYGFEDKQYMTNIKFSFNYNNNGYSIAYSGDLCENGVSYSLRSGTILPVYINVKLTLTDNSLKKDQVLFQIPSGMDFNLTGIYYGDLDKDKEPDIILTILYGSWKCNLVYLSTKKKAGNLVEYLGYYEAESIDP
jgi:hypothetical protein